MLKTLCLCFGVLILACNLCHARGAGKSPPIPEGAGGSPISLGSTDINPNTIRGTCTLAEGQPCVDIVISLTDEKGSEVARARTSAKGTFKFAADQAKKYRLHPASFKYEVVSPNPVIHGGDNIELKLQQKPE